MPTPVTHVRRLEQPWALALVVAVALLLRVAVLLVPITQQADAGWYYDHAVEIMHGRGYGIAGTLTAFWPVGWPGFMAALFSLTGPSPIAAQIANLVMSVLICVLTGILGTIYFRNRSVGALAMLLLAVYPNQIAYVPLLLTEIFWATLLLVALLLLRRERVGTALLAGLLLGVGTLTKTQTLLLPAFLFGWLFLIRPSKAALRRYARLLCVIYVGMILVVAPWSYRNWTVFHAFVPVSTNGGWTLLTGNNPEANGDYTPKTVLAEGVFKEGTDGELVSDRVARERAIAWIKANPIKFVALLPRKFVRLWAPDGEAEWLYQRGYAGYEAHASIFRTLRVLNQGYYVLIMLLALPTMLILTWRRPLDIAAWAHTGIALSVFFTVLSLLFSGQSRFHFGLMPLISIYAALSILWAYSHIRNRAGVRCVGQSFDNA